MPIQTKADFSRRNLGGVVAAAEALAKQIKMSENYHKIRLPTWSPAEPQLWFVECEDLFTLAKVKDEDQKTKAILVRRELPAEVKNNIKDLILKPNPSSEYTDLKEAIIDQHKLSREESYIAIGNMTLGDQKPSTLGQGILATIPAKCDCDKTSDGCDYKKWIFECLFKEKLPVGKERTSGHGTQHQNPVKLPGPSR